jgi:hypothetical protein
MLPSVKTLAQILMAGCGLLSWISACRKMYCSEPTMALPWLNCRVWFPASRKGQSFSQYHLHSRRDRPSSPMRRLTGDRARLEDIIHRTPTPTRVRFCIELDRRPPQSRPQHDILIAVLRCLWDDFRLDASTTCTHPQGMLLQPREIVQLLEFVRKHEDAIHLSMDGALDKLADAVMAASSAEIEQSLQALVTMIVSDPVPSVFMADQSLIPAAERLARAIIQRYLAFCLGPPPSRGDWRCRPRGTCQCRDCVQINAFLVSPTEHVGRFPLAKARRYHLHRQFTDSSTGSYSVTTLCDTNPNVWQITKKEPKSMFRRAQWKARFKEAKKWLRSLCQDSTRLQKLLGERYEVVMGLDLNRIIAVPLYVRGESTSTLADQIPRASRPKRAISDATEDANKRHRVVPIVDLTED